MSHRDVSDIEFPPGLAALPSPSAEQGQTRAYNRFSFFPLNGFPAHDRHGTNGPQRTPTLSPTQPASPRSFGMQDHEYGITHIDANTWPSPLGTNSRAHNPPFQLHQPNFPPPSHLSSSPPRSGPATFQNFDNARSGPLPQSTYKDQDSHLPRVSKTTTNPSSQSQFVYTSSAASAVSPTPSTSPLTRSTLWWGARTLLPILSQANRLIIRAIAFLPSRHPRTPLPYSLRSITKGAGLPLLCQTRTSHSFSIGHHPLPFHHHSPPLASLLSHNNTRRSTAFSLVIWLPRLPTQTSLQFFVTLSSVCAVTVNLRSSAHS